MRKKKMRKTQDGDVNTANIDFHDRKQWVKIFNEKPEHFYYDDGEYEISTNHWGKSLSVSINTKNEVSEAQKNLISKWEKYCKLPAGCIWPALSLDSYPKEVAWYFDLWNSQVYELIRFFDIPQNTRKKMYKVYRWVTKKRLEMIIKKYNQIINNVLKDSYPGLINDFIDKRDRYQKALNDLKDEKSGYYKFLYPLIRPIFTGLSVLAFKPEQQIEAVYQLFLWGNFDNYREELGENGAARKPRKRIQGEIWDKQIKRIRSIRVAALEIIKQDSE